MKKNNEMLNFTVGPVKTFDYISDIGAEQVPYFRTEEFSNIMLENEKLVKKIAGANEESRCVFITGSGTASMEAAIINTLTKDDKILIVNGGSFGQRFVDICRTHEISYDEIKLQSGCTLTEDELKKYDGNKYTAFAVNICETSTGVYYDINMISSYCKKYNLLLIVDAISSFLADPLNMDELNIDVLITGSQKALACPPGVSIIILSARAINKVYSFETKTLYLNLQSALENGKRGQTPFTPAVGILRQINARLKQIDKDGGYKFELSRHKKLAEDFRNKIEGLPLEIFSDSLSNSVTSLHPLNMSAYDVFLILKNDYNIWVCPNGGFLKDEVFRVGHIGNLTEKDNETLVNALKEVLK